MTEDLKDAIMVVADMAEEQGQAGMATALRLLAMPATGLLLDDRERGDRPGIKSQLAVTVVNWCQGSRSGPLTGFKIEQHPDLDTLAVFLDYGDFRVVHRFSHRERPEMAIHELDGLAEQARLARVLRMPRNPGISRVLDWTPDWQGNVS